MSVFTQWIHGQPWWATLLLLPAIVLAGLVARVLRYVLLALIVAAGIGGVAALWAWRRR